MNEIIQNLETNATNGYESFCYISENELNAIKELSKREQQEKEHLQSVIDKVFKIIESYNIGKYDYSIPQIGIIELFEALKGDKE